MLYRYEKGTLPNPPYLGFEASKLHLLLHQRPRDKVQLIPDDVDCTQGKVSMRDELVENCSHVGSVIVYCNEALEELYHFILPLRAHYLHTSLLKPLVIMLNNSLPSQLPPIPTPSHPNSLPSQLPTIPIPYHPNSLPSQLPTIPTPYHPNSLPSQLPTIPTPYHPNSLPSQLSPFPLFFFFTP